MDASRFDAVARSIARAPSRRQLLALVIAGMAPLLQVGAGEARKRRKTKKACGPCAKRKNGKCKPDAEGTPCADGKICRSGRCECQQACPSDRECLANGSCARLCPASFDCGPGCGCGLASVEGPQFCIVSEGGCEFFTQGCESNAECPIGQHCMTTFCLTAPFNRCISLCPG